MERSQIVEVSLRDGLMHCPPIANNIKRELLVRLMSCGMRTFEVIRFPLDGKYPQFDDGVSLLGDLQSVRGRECRLAAFAVGAKGVEEAARYSDLFDELHVPCFVSDSYARYAFGEWDWRSSLRFIESTLTACQGRELQVTVGLGTSFGCPIRKSHSVSDTIERVADLVALGVGTVMLGDTAGTATPSLVAETLSRIKDDYRGRPDVVRVHFHNTFGKALLNSYSALVSGADGIDTSLLGLGGEPHPYFCEPEMVDNGNCATEEIVEFMESEEGGGRGERGRGEIFETARWFAGQVPSRAFRRSVFAEFVDCHGEQMTGKG